MRLLAKLVFDPAPPVNCKWPQKFHFYFKPIGCGAGAVNAAAAAFGF